MITGPGYAGVVSAYANEAGARPGHRLSRAVGRAARTRGAVPVSGALVMGRHRKNLRNSKQAAKVDDKAKTAENAETTF